jgi:hypothetical protein
MISKSGHQGNAGGHGMTTLSVAQEIAKEEAKLLSGHSGVWLTCPWCSEEYHMNKDEYDSKDAGILRLYLGKHRCPLCNWKDEEVISLRKQVYTLEFSVEHSGKTHQIKAVHKPQGWSKPKKVKTYAEQEASARKHNKLYVK